MQWHLNHRPLKVNSKELEKDIFIKNLEVNQFQGKYQKESTNDHKNSTKTGLITDSIVRLEECENIKYKIDTLLKGILNRSRWIYL